jgi:hypothetical protein
MIETPADYRSFVFLFGRVPAGQAVRYTLFSFLKKDFHFHPSRKKIANAMNLEKFS